MSNTWQAWVESMKVDKNGGKKCADDGGIYGIEDGNPWAQSQNFNMTQKEVKDIVSILSGQSSSPSLLVGGNKYILLQKNDDFVTAKAGQKGLTASKAKTCVVIGHYNDHGVIPAGTNCKRVFEVRESLIEYGF